MKKNKHSNVTKQYGKVEQVTDSFQAFLVKGAEFTDLEEYPVIPNEFIPTEVPKKIMPFQKAIAYHGDLSETYICTYAPDGTFERIRRNPQKYTRFFKRTAGLIGFDFSIHTDMNLIKQKAQMNDNLSLTYYYGAQGNSIIPNISLSFYTLEQRARTRRVKSPGSTCPDDRQAKRSRSRGTCAVKAAGALLRYGLRRCSTTRKRWDSIDSSVFVCA